MASEVHEFSVIVPAGTAQVRPVTFNLAMPPRQVDEVQVQVPPGPRGEVGFAIGAAGVKIIPYEPGVFVVTDNELVKWPLEDQIDSGAWQLIAYNTGAFNHTLYIRFLTRLPHGLTDPAPFSPLNLATLASPPPPVNGGPAPPPLPPPRL